MLASRLVLHAIGAAEGVVSRAPHYLCPSGLTPLTYIYYFSFYYFSYLHRADRDDFQLPRNLDDAKRLGLILSRYKEQHYYAVLFGILTVYIL